MSISNLKNKSTKDLKDTLKMLKIVAISLSIVIFLLLSICIYGLIYKENNPTFLALLVFGFSCSAMLQLNSMKKINFEIKYRK